MPVVIAENLRKEFKKAASKDKGKRKRSKSKSETVKAAVRNQTFAVEAGEVFGLLGPNGAGKTTTLNMMIAEIGPDCGRVSLINILIVIYLKFFVHSNSNVEFTIMKIRCCSCNV